MGKRRDIKIAEMVGKPIGVKMEQLEATVRRDGELTREEYSKQICDLKNVVNAVLNDLSEKEKKEVYDLNTLIDIATLDETERRFLVEILYTLANMTEQAEDSQKSFISSIQKYLGITNVQTYVNLEIIENIDNISIQKALLQPVMEFLYLGNLDHSYLDEYEDVFSYFSVSRKGISEIKSAIDNICKAIGTSGLYEKYGFSKGASFEDSKNIINAIVSVNKIGKYIPDEEFFDDFFNIRYESKKEYYKNIKGDLQNRVSTFFKTKNPVKCSIDYYKENLHLIIDILTKRFELKQSELINIIDDYQTYVSKHSNSSEYFNVDFSGALDEPQLFKLKHVGVVYLNIKEEKLYVINNYQKNKIINSFVKAYDDIFDDLYKKYEESLDCIIERVLSLKINVENKNHDISDIDDASQLYDIGMRYLNGIGVDVSKTEALKWLCKSASMGNEEAKNTIKENFVEEGNIIFILEKSVLFTKLEIDNTVFPFKTFHKIMLLKSDGNFIELKSFPSSSSITDFYIGSTERYSNGFVFDVREQQELFIINFNETTSELSLIDSWKIPHSQNHCEALLNSNLLIDGDKVKYKVMSIFTNEVLFEKEYMLKDIII